MGIVAMIMPNADVSYLDKLLLNDAGHLVPLPAKELRAVPPGHLRLWAHHHAVYQFPTVELIDWLRERIGDRKAIEIGAGHGAIARALGCVATDSYIQTQPECRRIYERSGQPIVEPASDVKRFEASEAVLQLGPQVVFGAWVTQKYRESDGADQHASIWGIDEDEILSRVGEYIVIGNIEPHGRKRILARRHKVLQPSWLVSRAGNQSLNAIWIWKGGR